MLGRGSDVKFKFLSEMKVHSILGKDTIDIIN